jgi:hypothetical protein
MLGFERQVMQDLSMAVQYTHRSYPGGWGSLPDIPVAQLGNLWIPAGNATFHSVVGDFTVPYYHLNPDLVEANGTNRVLRNFEGYDQKYDGVDINVRKRMSNNFMLNGSLVLQRQKAEYSSIDGYVGGVGDGGITPGNPFNWDPSLIPFQDGLPYAYAQTSSGKGGVYPYATWQFKLSGVYQFPADINVGAFMRYQEGYPYVIWGRVSESAYGGATFTNGVTSTQRLLVEDFGSRRYDNMFTLDMQVEKAFAFGQYGKLTLSANFFNLLNSNTVIRRTRDLGSPTSPSSTFNLIDENLSPRAVRVGVRYSF